MVRTIKARFLQDYSRTWFLYAGISGDTKPTGPRQSTGSLYIEVDTGILYGYEEVSATWYAWGNLLPFFMDAIAD